MAAAILVTLVVSCNPRTERPPFSPLVQAVIDTLGAEPAEVINAVGSEAVANGVALRLFSTLDGFVETRPFNVVAGHPGPTDVHHPERVVILRFWADAAVGGRTKLTSEAVYRRSADPSLGPRDQEVMAPLDHLGRQLLQRIRDGVKKTLLRD